MLGIKPLDRGRLPKLNIQYSFYSTSIKRPVLVSIESHLIKCVLLSSQGSLTALPWKASGHTAWNRRFHCTVTSNRAPYVVALPAAAPSRSALDLSVANVHCATATTTRHDMAFYYDLDWNPATFWRDRCASRHQSLCQS